MSNTDISCSVFQVADKEKTERCSETEKATMCPLSNPSQFNQSFVNDLPTCSTLRFVVHGLSSKAFFLQTSGARWRYHVPGYFTFPLTDELCHKHDPTALTAKATR